MASIGKNPRPAAQAAPLRLVVTGEFTSGKSTAINTLLRKRLLPSAFGGTKSPPIRIRHGDQTTIRIVTATGEALHAATIEEAIANDAAEEILVTTPFPDLKGIEIDEVPTGADNQFDDDALDIIAKADMLIWCTIGSQAWRLSEKSTVESLPASLRPQSVLLLSRADKLRSSSDCDKIMRRLEREASSFFSNVIFMGGAPDLIDESAQDQRAWQDTGGQYIAEIVRELFGDRADAAAMPFEGLDLAPEAEPAIPAPAAVVPTVPPVVPTMAPATAPEGQIVPFVAHARPAPATAAPTAAPIPPQPPLVLTTTAPLDGSGPVIFSPRRGAALLPPLVPPEPTAPAPAPAPAQDLAGILSAAPPTIPPVAAVPPTLAPAVPPAVAPATVAATVAAPGPAEIRALFAALTGLHAAGHVETATGHVLQSFHDRGDDGAAIARAGALLLATQRRAMTLTSARDALEEMVFSLKSRLYIIRPLDADCAGFVFLAMDRAGSNLAIARLLLRDVAARLTPDHPST